MGKPEIIILNVLCDPRSACSAYHFNLIQNILIETLRGDIFNCLFLSGGQLTGEFHVELQ